MAAADGVVGMWWPISARERSTAGLRIARRTTGLIADRCPIPIQMPGNARAGMDDTPHPRKGELTAGHRPLVRRAVMLARDLDLPSAGMADKERDLGIAS